MASSKRPAPPSDGNWRNAYQAQVRDSFDQYVEWRRLGMPVRVELRGRTRQLRYLTDAEILEVARRESEVDLNYAINQQLENDKNLRERFGEAL